MKVRRAAPVLLVFLVGGVLAQLQPGLVVRSGALILPLLVVASLIVAPIWSATPPQLAVIAAAFATLPAVHHAWVFNIEGNGFLVWAALLAVVPFSLAVVVARGTSLVRQLGVGRPVFAVLIAANSFFYGMGAAYFANTVFDRGPVQRFEATVEARVVKSHFGFLWKQYHLNVSPWGNHQRGDSITVEPEVIEAVSVGERVHIEQLPGFLGIAWVRATAR